MNREKCMLMLEEMICELSQYRNITNELCNRYISDYVRNEYEQKEILMGGDPESCRNYSWDIYDTIPIDILETILDFFKGDEYE